MFRLLTMSKASGLAASCQTRVALIKAAVNLHRSFTMSTASALDPSWQNRVVLNCIAFSIHVSDAAAVYFRFHARQVGCRTTQADINMSANHRRSTYPLHPASRAAARRDDLRRRIGDPVASVIDVGQRKTAVESAVEQSR